MSLYAVIVQQFDVTLGNLDAILDKANGNAVARGFAADVFLQARLAPDMLAFGRQVQIACDIAKGAAAHVAGQTPPRFEDNEATLVELRARIAKTREYIASLDLTVAAASDGERLVTPGYPPGKQMRLHDYVVVRQLPNFHFHVVTAYGLLRHWGVPLGKADYLGELPLI